LEYILRVVRNCWKEDLRPEEKLLVEVLQLSEEAPLVVWTVVLRRTERPLEVAVPGRRWAAGQQTVTIWPEEEDLEYSF
jgi:hypothetical protein